MSVLIFVQDVIVVVTTAHFHLRHRIVNAFTNRMWFGEIHGSSANVGNFSGWDQLRISNSSREIGINDQNMIQNIAHSFTFQVKINMVGQIEET